MTIDKPLTEMQRRFCEHYIVSGNATDAAKRAGYSPHSAANTGYSTLKKPQIQKYLAELSRDRNNDLIANQEEVLKFLTNVMRGETSETVATAKGLYEGVEIQAKDKIKAAELLGKREGLWIDKHELEGKIQIPKIIDDITGSDSHGD
ncbi:terminase small subunit [Lactobacillus acetotolerans]|uniref:terminase small subunit n=1 Tax=Lactobacillus acetotolerans TaxID=1600 RepID=UPI002FD97AA2